MFLLRHSHCSHALLGNDSVAIASRFDIKEALPWTMLQLRRKCAFLLPGGLPSYQFCGQRKEWADAAQWVEQWPLISLHPVTTLLLRQCFFFWIGLVLCSYGGRRRTLDQSCVSRWFAPEAFRCWCWLRTFLVFCAFAHNFYLKFKVKI